ncbi:putative Late nodulin [Medicago truncatula]|uniref:Putative Late nodulin n=1 Tax=Medicago truncatula TaxID=3880 RepID=A0A396HAR8_MEDTR|nr:putative Late nodulin [Medicago truncatula]
MTTILKFAYIMITCLFLLHIAAQEVLQYELFDCNEDRDCDNVICVAVRNMTTILKFPYIMVICLLLLHVAAYEDFEKEIFDCKKDGDCDHMCVTPGIPKCTGLIEYIDTIQIQIR